MRRTYLIRLVYVDTTGTQRQEEEVVLVDASSVEEAARLAMLRNRVAAVGRLVEKYDENGTRIYG